MESYGRWSLLGALSFFAVGVFMLIKGVGPEWHSYVTVVVVFVAAAAWTARYIVDTRKARKAIARNEDDAAADGDRSFDAG